MDIDDNNENSVITHDCIFDGVIQDPFDFPVDFSNGSVNNLTLRMRVQLAKKEDWIQYPLYKFVSAGLR